MMDDTYLLNLKVVIDVSDDVNFLELAILLDKPEFLALLPKLRSEYDISNLIGIDEYYGLVDSFTDDEVYKINFSKYPDSENLIKYVRENTTANLDPERSMDRFQLIDTEAAILCYIFKRSANFSEAIKHTIFCGAVNDASLRNTSVEMVENDRLLTSVSDFGHPRLAILVTPTTTDRELSKAMDVARMLYQTDPRLSYYKPRTDKVNRIKAYRGWYWMHLSGMSYEKITETIAESADPDLVEFDYNRVGKSIRFYKKLLAQ